MRYRILPLAAGVFGLLASTVEAGLCGVSSYQCCPTSACAPASCYTTCRVATETCYRTVCETVYEPQEYTSTRGEKPVCMRVPANG